ncbi:hypothetical protein K456DRAFT_1767048 [Colletotrichum gloeosporioides 23]|nr:hypothetical protein K456DRAFT_1767048 [Colletotrichum gloeosporioides 23]
MIPFTTDFESWAAQVREHNVSHLTLSQLRDTHFSGSRIPHAAFLQLRAIWPPVQTADKALHALRRAGFIPDDDGGDGTGATSGRERKTPVTGRLYTEAECHLRALLGQMAPARPAGEPTTTPIAQSTWSSKLELLEAEEKLGIFAPCLSLWRQARPVPGAHVDTDTQKGQIPPGLPPRSEEDGSDDSPSESGDSSCEDLLALSFSDCEADFSRLMQDTPSKPPKDFKVSAPSEDPPIPATDSSESEGEPPTWNFEGRSEGTYKRTPYEAQTTVFFVAFFHALFTYRLSMLWSELVRVAAEERQYKFDPSLFTACPDGAFYTPPFSPDPFLFFELKPFQRRMQRDKICREETAEMAAILSQQLALSRVAQTKLSEDESHNRLTISLNRDEYYITIVSYTTSYLRYINKPNNVTYSDGLSNQDMIWFQSYGPFRFNDRPVMYDFCSLVTAVVANKMGESKEACGPLDEHEALYCEQLRIAPSAGRLSSNVRVAKWFTASRMSGLLACASKPTKRAELESLSKAVSIPSVTQRREDPPPVMELGKNYADAGDWETVLPNEAKDFMLEIDGPHRTRARFFRNEATPEAQARFPKMLDILRLGEKQHKITWKLMAQSPLMRTISNLSFAAASLQAQARLMPVHSLDVPSRDYQVNKRHPEEERYHHQGKKIDYV